MTTGLRERLQRFLGLDTKASKTAKFVAWASGGQPVWTPRDFVEPRPRRLHQERRRLSRRAHDRRSRRLRAALSVRRRAGDRHPRAAVAASAPQPDAMRARPAGGVVRPSDGGGERLSRGGGGRGPGARAACAAARPHEIGAGAGRLAGGLRIRGGRADRALRAGRRRHPADPAHGAVPSAQRPLRLEPAGAGGDERRSAQRLRRVEQGAARQLGLPVGRAGLYRQGRAADAGAI